MVVCLCLARCQLSQRDPTGQRGAALEELPAAGSLRTHQSLLRTWFFIDGATTKSRPRGREYTRPCQIRPVLIAISWVNVFRLRSPQSSVQHNDARSGIGTLAAPTD